MSNKKKKVSLWIFSISVLVGIVLLFWENYFKGNLLIVAVAFFAFLPFIDRAIKSNFEGDSFNILGVPFVSFITPWVMFWGLSGGVISYKQTQENNKQLQQQLNAQERIEREKNYHNYVGYLVVSNEGIRNKAINDLYQYAYKYSAEFLKPVCDAFCSHIREITSDSVYRAKNKETPRNDIQNIIDLLFKKNDDTLIFNQVRKSLEGAYLHGANFQNAILNNIDFEAATLSNANFKSAKLNDVSFIAAILNANLNFDGAELTNVNFRYGRLTNVNFKNSKIIPGKFYGATLTDVQFDNAHINVGNFELSEMINVSFINDSLKDVSFRHVKVYQNVNFANAKFNNVDFWTRTKPKKEEVNFKGTIFEKDDIERITSLNYTTSRTNPKKTE